MKAMINFRTTVTNKKCIISPNNVEYTFTFHHHHDTNSDVHCSDFHTCWHTVANALLFLATFDNNENAVQII